MRYFHPESPSPSHLQASLQALPCPSAPQVVQRYSFALLAQLAQTAFPTLKQKTLTIIPLSYPLAMLVTLQGRE